MDLTQYMSEDLVALNVDLHTGEEVLEYLASMVERAGVGPDAISLTTTLMEREKLGSTGVGHSLAIPHVHIDIDRITVGFLRTIDEIDFQAIDGKPCQLFFLVISSRDDKRAYLNALASIATRAKHKDILEELREAGSPEEVLSILKG